MYCIVTEICVNSIYICKISIELHCIVLGWGSVMSTLIEFTIQPLCLMQTWGFPLAPPSSLFQKLSTSGRSAAAGAMPDFAVTELVSTYPIVFLSWHLTEQWSVSKLKSSFNSGFLDLKRFLLLFGQRVDKCSCY